MNFFYRKSNRTAHQTPKSEKNREQSRPQPDSIGQRAQKHHPQRHGLEPADGREHSQKKQRAQRSEGKQEIRKRGEKPPGQLPSQGAEQVEHARQPDSQCETDAQQPCLRFDGDNHPKSLPKNPARSGSSA